MLPSERFLGADPVGATTPRTLVERAYLQLRHDIVSGALAPGERLRVEHLKDRYEVGAGTLREALSLLVSDALVTAEGQRGFRVAPISLADLEDVTNTRVMLETEALRLSIRHGDAAWRQRVEQSFQRLSRCEQSPDGARNPDWEECNRVFHEALISGHLSPWMRYLLGILYRHTERYRHIVLSLGVQTGPGGRRDVHREHEDICLAALARQEARAALALEAHVRLTCELLQAHAATVFGAALPAEGAADQA